jgi:hypothetical protein
MCNNGSLKRATSDETTTKVILYLLFMHTLPPMFSRKEKKDFQASYGDTIRKLGPKFEKVFEEDEQKSSPKQKKKPTRRYVIDKSPSAKAEASSEDGKLLGLKVKKTFLDEYTGKYRPFSGIVAAYVAQHRLYKVYYGDGDEEELTPTEVEEILVSEFNDAPAVHGDKKKRKRPKARKSHSVLEILPNAQNSEHSFRVGLGDLVEIRDVFYLDMLEKFMECLLIT